jgi:hypothetical protein
MNNSIVFYDSIERYKKGTPKEDEIERYETDYGLDISNLTKGKFYPITIKSGKTKTTRNYQKRA